jgi:hypothetical protein
MLQANLPSFSFSRETPEKRELSGIAKLEGGRPAMRVLLLYFETKF